MFLEVFVMLKGYKKIIAVILTIAVIFSNVQFAFAVQGAQTGAFADRKSNGNGNATDVGIWFTTYNNLQFWNLRFSSPSNFPVGYKVLLPDGSFGIPDSNNIDIIDFQIEMMATAGIDFVIFDLTNGNISDKVGGWGTDLTLDELAEETNKGYYANADWIVQNTFLTCERLSLWNDSHDWQIKYCIAVGAYKEIRKENPIGLMAEGQAEGIQKMFLDNPVFGDDYYCYDGDGNGTAEPLMVLHSWHEKNTVTVTTKDDGVEGYNEYKENGGDVTYSSKFAIRAGNDGYNGSIAWEIHKNHGVGEHSEEIESVCPGQTNRNGLTSRVYANNGGTEDIYSTYEAGWNMVLDGVPPRILVISSLNDYMEDTAILPTDSLGAVELHKEEVWLNENGEMDPYYYWDMTVEKLAELRKKGGEVKAPTTAFKNFASAKNGATITTDAPRSQGLNSAIDGKIDNNRAIVYYGNADGTNYSQVRYYEVDFASKSNINNVFVALDKVEPLYCMDYALDVKLSDGTWQRVAEVHYNNEKEIAESKSINFMFENIDALAIRILAHNGRHSAGAGTNAVFSLAEISVYNNPTIKDGDYTGIASSVEYEIPKYVVVSENYALNCTVTMSAYTRGLEDSWPVSYVTNGKYNSSMYAYFSDNGDTNYLASQYIQVDFGKLRTINEVVFVSCSLADQFVNDYAVEVLLTNGSWKRVATRHYSVEGEIVTSKSQKVHFYFAPEDAVAIRVYGNATNHSDILKNANISPKTVTFSCTEIEVYYNSSVTASKYTGIAIPTDSAVILGDISDNYALTATISQTYYNYDEAGPIKNINDGKISNRSLSYANPGNVNTTDQTRIVFTFDTAKIINIVNLYADNCEANKYGFKDLAIDVFSDGGWVRVAEIHNITVTNKQLVPVCFESISATKVAITVDTSNQVNKTFASFAEVEIFNDTAITEKDYTGITEPTFENTKIARLSGKNYALGKKVKRSGNDIYFYKNFVEYNATDGNVDHNTNLGCAITDYYLGKASFTVDLGDETVINKVKVHLSVHEIKMTPHVFFVEVLTNKGWLLVATKENFANSYVLDFNFEAVEAYAFRVSGDRSGNEEAGLEKSSNFRVVELEAYYDYNMQESEYTGTEASIKVIEGDVNNDGWVNAVDLARAVNWYIGADKWYQTHMQMMDANRDGKYDIRDYICIVETIANYGRYIISQNYALNCTVTTSAFPRDLADKWPISNVTNGKYNVSMYAYFSDTYNKNYSASHYIQVDFGQKRTINQVVFVACILEGKFLNDYAVDVLLTDGTWKRVATRHYSVEGEIVTRRSQKINFYFAPEEAVAIRVYGNVTNHSDVLENPNIERKTRIFSCTEIEAYYNPSVTKSTYTGIAVPTDGVVMGFAN